MSKAPVEFLGCRLQVDDLSTPLEMLTIGWTKNHTAPRGQDPGRSLRQRVDDFFLNIAEPRFAFSLEKFPDGATQSRLDCVVRVNKWDMKSSGELASDGGFSRTGQSNKTEYQLISDRSPSQQSFSE